MKVTVIGAGGVGGYFGARLADTGVEVSYVARGAHLDAIRKDGLRVRSPLGDVEVRPRATDDPAELEPADYVVLTVKSYDTDAAASFLPGLVGPGSAVISLQNGVDNEEKLAAVVGDARVVGGAAYIFATIAGPGVIEHTAGPASLRLGEWTGGRSDRVGAFVAACREAGVTADEVDDIRSVLWSKFAFICAQAGVTAAARLPIGEIRSTPAGRLLFQRLAADVCAVAAAEGVALPAELPARALEMADELDAGAHSSLHYDLTHGRRMELDALLGEVIRRGRKSGVEVPTSEAVYGVLAPWAARVADG